MKHFTSAERFCLFYTINNYIQRASELDISRNFHLPSFQNLTFFCLRLQAPEALCFRVVRPSVRPSEAWNTLFWPVHRSVGPPDQLWPFYGMSVRPSFRPARFPGICRRTHGDNGLKFYMLMYLAHLQNWLVYGLGLFIFLILALFWLSETGQIWGFRAFPGECMKEMTWNFACWCILTTFRTD